MQHMRVEAYLVLLSGNGKHKETLHYATLIKKIFAMIKKLDAICDSLWISVGVNGRSHYYFFLKMYGSLLQYKSIKWQPFVYLYSKFNVKLRGNH